MKTNPLVLALSSFVLLFPSVNFSADTAMVKEDRVNVRAQASLAGEVITQLRKGERATILEAITTAKPKPGEPTNWFRIQMPANTPVWVFASLIDPVNKTVQVSRANLRAGPGENYSVVGRLDRGEAVKEIRIVEQWMEIETPSVAYAFVAANLLEPVAGSDSSPAKIERPAPAPTNAPPPIVVAPSTNLTTVKVEEPPPVISPVVAPPAKEAPPISAESTNTSTNIFRPPPALELINTNAPPATSSEASPREAPSDREPGGDRPKRVVHREGIVRSTVSIQAPSYFELISAETRKTINYLHTTNPELKLKDFRGRNVVVSGEEGIDPRWRNTPVIEIQTIEIAP